MAVSSNSNRKRGAYPRGSIDCAKSGATHFTEDAKRKCQHCRRANPEIGTRKAQRRMPEMNFGDDTNEATSSVNSMISREQELESAIAKSQAELLKVRSERYQLETKEALLVPADKETGNNVYQKHKLLSAMNSFKLINEDDLTTDEINATADSINKIRGSFGRKMNVEVDHENKTGYTLPRTTTLRDFNYSSNLKPVGEDEKNEMRKRVDNTIDESLQHYNKNLRHQDQRMIPLAYEYAGSYGTGLIRIHIDKDAKGGYSQDSPATITEFEFDSSNAEKTTASGSLAEMRVKFKKEMGKQR